MKIYEKLSNVQAELKAPKSQFNKFGGYSYRSCEDVLESVKPILNKNKLTLIISDSIEVIQDRIYVKAICTLIDSEDGSKIETYALAREPQTKKGMDESQITGSSSSYARKYALNGLFLIDDNKDSDYTNTGDKEVRELSDSQIKRLYAIANAKGHNKETVDKAIRKYGVDSAKKLSKKQYDELVERLENS